MNWNEKLIAFLHDPPDKALKILNHEERAKKLLSSVQLNWKKIKADEISSSLQRIVFESSGKEPSSDFYAKSSGKYVHVGYPVLKHPITECKKGYENLNRFCDYLRKTYGYSKLDEFIKDVLNVEIDCLKELWSNGRKNGYFRVWNCYKEVLKKRLVELLRRKWSIFIKATFGENNSIYNSLADEMVNLPAETRCSDHTIWDHLDATSTIHGATLNGRKPALLMFKLAPVQDFIKNARKERDLWAGSHLLSFLTFQAIKNVVDEFGPDAIVFPHLRGQPFFDKAYENYFGDIHIRNGELKKKLKIANIPNKFLAIVGFKDESDIKELREKVVKSVEDTIGKIFKYAWERILPDESTQDSILNNVKKELTKLKEKAERENISRDVERYEKALKELERCSNNLENYKACYQQLAEKYFRITLEILEVPFDNLGDRKESYRKLKEFVKSLGLPEKTESKYVEWIELLESFGTYPARPFDLYSLMFELLEEVIAVESRKFEKIVGFEKTDDDCKDKGGYKCSLCGEAEAICGKNYTLMKVLWSEIGRRNPFLIKKNEHLCPICLVKRFYHEWLNENGWEVDAGFESVSEVAMRKNVEFVRNKTVTHLDILKDKEISELERLEEYGINPEKIRKLHSKYEALDNVFKELLSLLITEVYKGKSLPKELISRLITDDVEFFYKEKLTLDNLLEEYGFPRFDEIRKVIEDDSTLKEVERKKARIESLISEITRLLDELPFEPEKYYAILIMDGDNMGKMLIGDEMKYVKEYLHPKVFRHLPEEAKKKVEKTKRLITPATHSAISRALAHFSINVVPDVVNTNRGELIYAGGDDVLALLPIDSALECAYEIQKKFGEKWDGWNVLPAKTMSGGILIVHYKHPLYDALDKTRLLEKKAKEMGRDCVAVGHLKRGGSYDEVVFNWSLAKKLSEVIADYSILDLMIRSKKREREPPYISERLGYDILREIDSLPNDAGAIEQFLKYELSRHYHDEKERKKRILEDLTAKIVECARRVRVTMSKEELESVLKLTLSKADVKKVNDLVKSIVREFKECEDNCPDVKGSLRRGINGKKGLEEQFNITDEKIYEELDGLILKKQVKGLLILLKILVDCNEELRCSS